MEALFQLIAVALRGIAVQVVNADLLNVFEHQKQGVRAGAANHARADLGKNLGVPAGIVFGAKCGDRACTGRAEGVGGKKRNRCAGIGIIQKRCQDRAGQAAVTVGNV